MIDWSRYATQVNSGMTNGTSGGNLFILYGPTQYYGTVTASQAATGYPASRLADRSTSLPWRSTGISGVTITATFPSSTAVYGVALLETNLTSAATITWQTSNDGTTWSAGVSEFGFNGGRAYRAYPPAALTGKYHRLTITTAVGSYIEVGEVYLAGGFWPVGGLENAQPLKSSQRWVDVTTTRLESQTGTIRADVRGAREMYLLRYDGLTAAQVNAFRGAHAGGYVVLSPRGNQGPYLYGLWEMGRETLGARSSCEVTFTEAR